MRPILLLTAVAILGFGPRSVNAQAPSDREAVRLAVLDYVEGFYEGDTTRLVRSVWTEVRKYGYWRAKPDSPYTGEAMPFPAFRRLLFALLRIGLFVLTLHLTVLSRTSL